MGIQIKSICFRRMLQKCNMRICVYTHHRFKDVYKEPSLPITPQTYKMTHLKFRTPDLCIFNVKAWSKKKKKKKKFLCIHLHSLLYLNIATVTLK